MRAGVARCAVKATPEGLHPGRAGPRDGAGRRTRAARGLNAGTRADGPKHKTRGAGWTGPGRGRPFPRPGSPPDGSPAGTVCNSGQRPGSSQLPARAPAQAAGATCPGIAAGDVARDAGSSPRARGGVQGPPGAGCQDAAGGAYNRLRHSGRIVRRRGRPCFRRTDRRPRPGGAGWTRSRIHAGT